MPPSTAAVIPRFLLPQKGAIWRQSTSRLQTIRHASSAKPVPKKSKPLVLEKPAKFTPPSHPARRFKEPPRYPGPKLSSEEESTMKTKKYPHMMPPEGTFMHWFVTNKSVHLYITLGTLMALASTVWFTNFKRNSPFTEMLPPGTQFFFHPIKYIRTFFEVVKMTGDYNTIQTMERRKAKVEDVAKRHEYRKAHGLDKDESFGGWTAKSDDELLGPGIKLGDGNKDASEVEAVVATEGAAQEEQPIKRERQPVKKWLGIW
ncbi:hypothetical protein G7Y89_g3118 [Cudoniella acicularis]|uniref:Uncharacterized protein n=1 Tax=Cudoniella acicularis TaxID=354080 RepID=A0A8H4RS18_9HELO|nr:hypothetical protein G7Y89_g3118 [Cudoniella acicularis]